MKKLLSLLLAGMCFMSMTLTVHAEEPYLIDPEPKALLRDVTTVHDGEVYQIIKIYDAPPGYAADSLAEPGFEKSGVSYAVGDIIQVKENHAEETKLAAQTVTLSHETKSHPALTPILDYQMDGYSGQLQLDTSSVSTESTGSKSYSYSVSDSREITGLARNDTYAVPKTATKNGVTLKLADIAWTNLGTSYTATATYTGTGYGSKVTGYTTTAVYIGEVKKDTVQSVTWKVIYEGTLIPVEEPDSDMAYLCGAAVVISILAAITLIVWLWDRRKPKTLKVVQEEL